MFLFSCIQLCALQLCSMVLPHCHSHGLVLVSHKQIEGGSCGFIARCRLLFYEYCSQMDQMRNTGMHRQITEQNRMGISRVIVTVVTFFQTSCSGHQPVYIVRCTLPLLFLTHGFDHKIRELQDLALVGNLGESAGLVTPGLNVQTSRRPLFDD